MMSSSNSITSMILSSIVVALLLSTTTDVFQVVQVQAQSTLDNRLIPVTCNICRSESRPLLNPNHAFTMPNGITWTCNYLQETVQDVNEQSSFDSERIMCRQAQLQAENGGCECGGAALAPLASQFTDINGACNLCAGQASNVVPISNYNDVVQTNIVGSMNCKGLYDAMIDGVLSANLCPTVQDAAGSICCNNDNINVTPPAQSTTTAAPTPPVQSSQQYTTATPIYTPPVQSPSQYTTTPPIPLVNNNDISYNNGSQASSSSTAADTAALPPWRVPATPAPQYALQDSTTAAVTTTTTQGSSSSTSSSNTGTSTGSIFPGWQQQGRESPYIRGAHDSPSF